MSEPMYCDVAYGDHTRNVLDFYRAEGEKTPLLVYIHGGGFKGGDKNALPSALLDACLAAGISVATINYPLSDTDPYPASAINFVTENSPPVLMWYRTRNVPMSPEPDHNTGIHHPKVGRVG